MTSGLGQQQFNLSNLSSCASTCCDSGFLYHRISAVKNGREFQARLVTSIVVRVELFEKRPSILWKLSEVFYRFRWRRCFMLPFQKRNSRDTSSENSRQVIVRTVFHLLQSFLALPDCHFNNLWIEFQFVVFIAQIHSYKTIQCTFLMHLWLSIRLLITLKKNSW